MTWLKLPFMQFLAFRRGRKARISLVIIMMIPLLYGALYVYAMWDPNSKLSNLPVALVNNDQPVTVDGKTIDLGPRIVSSLESADNVDWTVVSSDEALIGMRQNEYYFTVTIPRDFSQKVSTLASTNPEQANIILTANESANYITSQISSQLATQVAAGLSQEITTGFIDESLTAIEKLRVALTEAAEATAKLARGATKLSKGIGELADGTSSLASGAGEVAAGNASLAEATSDAASFADDANASVVALVGKLADYVDKHPTDPIARDLLALAKKGQATVNSVVKKIAAASKDINKLSAGSTKVAVGAEKLAAGADKLFSGSQALDQGADELAAGLSKGAAAIPVRSAEQIKALAKVAAEPVGVKTENINSVQTNGSAMFAYFVGLALWVGMLIGFTLLNPLPPRPLMSARTPTLCAVLVSYLPVALIGMGQVLVLTFVARQFIGLETVHPHLMLALMVVVSLTYCAIIQMLKGLFGTVGNILALVILAMQMNSSGGTYPIQMYPDFFQDISPYFPMSHIVRAARIAISGGDTGVFLHSLAIVACFGVGAFLLTWLGATRKRTVKIAEFKVGM